MTDYKQLEKLLSQLGGEIDHKFCIISPYINDFSHIATYDKEGMVEFTVTRPSISECVEQIKQYYSTAKVTQS